MNLITLTIGPMVTIHLMPDHINEYMPHWKGGSAIFTQFDERPFIVEEPFDAVTSKILEVAP